MAALTNPGRSQPSLKNARLDVFSFSFSKDGKEIPSSIETESQRSEVRKNTPDERLSHQLCPVGKHGA
jgi:hypothetical protein